MILFFIHKEKYVYRLRRAVELRAAVAEDVDGGPDALDDGEVQLGGDDLLAGPGLGQVSPQGSMRALPPPQAVSAAALLHRARNIWFSMARARARVSRCMARLAGHWLTTKSRSTPWRVRVRVSSGKRMS